MIKLLKNILTNQNSIEEEEGIKGLELLCGLMIEAAYTDGQIDKSELKKIKLSLINTFDENPNDVDSVIKDAIINKDNSKSLHYYTSYINKNLFCRHQKLMELIRMKFQLKQKLIKIRQRK